MHDVCVTGRTRLLSIRTRTRMSMVRTIHFTFTLLIMMISLPYSLPYLIIRWAQDGGYMCGSCQERHDQLLDLRSRERLPLERSHVSHGRREQHAAVSEVCTREWMCLGSEDLRGSSQAWHNRCAHLCPWERMSMERIDLLLRSAVGPCRLPQVCSRARL